MEAMEIDLRDTFSLITFVFSMGGGALGAYIAIRVKLEQMDARIKYLDRAAEVERDASTEHFKRIDASLARAHHRIDDLKDSKS